LRYIRRYICLNIGLFCKRSVQKRLYSAKETYILFVLHMSKHTYISEYAHVIYTKVHAFEEKRFECHYSNENELTTNMFWCIYICMYIYTYIHIYVYINVYIYIYMYVCVYVSVSVYMHIHIYVYIYIYICICIRMCICIHICVFIYVYTWV